MTQRKDLKRLIRARMAKTGESYTTARGHFRSLKGNGVMTDDNKVAFRGIQTVVLPARPGEPTR